jgi:hypothetical protein
MSVGNDRRHQIVCPKCNGSMEEGFLPDASRGVIQDTKWVRGKPEPHWLGGVKSPDQKFLGGLKDSTACKSVISYRCQKCGFLENYAR